MNKNFNCHTDLYHVPELNFLPEIVDQLNIPDYIKIHEVGLRECDQTPGTVLRGEEKVEMAREYGKLGVNSIEIYYLVSEEDRAALTEISSWKDRTFETTTFARSNPKDIEEAVSTGIDILQIESPISPTFARMYGFDTEDKIVKNLVDGIKYAKSLGVKVCAEPWDIGRAPVSLIERVWKSVAEAGADQIIWGDSVNNLMPWSVYWLQKKMIEWTEGKVEQAPHFHNDFGMATASTMAAIAAGATVANCALNSVGEKTGNADLAEIVVVAELLMGIKTDIKKELIYPTAKKFEEISKTPLGNNKPITGRREFQYGSGFVVDAINKSPTDYERVSILPFHPKVVGGPDFEIVWGKGVGSNMVNDLAKKLGITLDKAQRAYVRDRIKDESLIRKAALTEFDVRCYIDEALSK